MCRSCVDILLLWVHKVVRTFVVPDCFMIFLRKYQQTSYKTALVPISLSDISELFCSLSVHLDCAFNAEEYQDEHIIIIIEEGNKKFGPLELISLLNLYCTTQLTNHKEFLSFSRAASALTSLTVIVENFIEVTKSVEHINITVNSPTKKKRIVPRFN